MIELLFAFRVEGMKKRKATYESRKSKFEGWKIRNPDVMTSGLSLDLFDYKMRLRNPAADRTRTR